MAEHVQRRTCKEDGEGVEGFFMTYLSFSVPDLRPFQERFWLESIDLQKARLLLAKKTTHLLEFETGFQRWAFEKITGLRIDELATIPIEYFQSWRLGRGSVILIAKMITPIKIYTQAEYDDPRSGQFNPPLPVIEWQTMKLLLK